MEMEMLLPWNSILTKYNSWLGLFIFCNPQIVVLTFDRSLSERINALNKKYVVELKRPVGWGSKFGMSKCRTNNILEIKNYEY